MGLVVNLVLVYWRWAGSQGKPLAAAFGSENLAACREVVEEMCLDYPLAVEVASQGPRGWFDIPVD